MILAVVGVVIAFNVSLYLVLATFLKDNKRKASTVEFPELKGLVSEGNKRVAWSRARSSLAGRPILNGRPQGMLRRLKSLCTPRNKEELPLFSIDCTDFTPCRANGLYKAHSWPPTPGATMPTPGSPPQSLTRAAFARILPDGPSPTPASAAVLPMMSAEDLPMMSAAGPVMSAEQPVMSASKPAAPAAGEKHAAADVAEGLLRQALRTLYKQHYGVPSIKVPKDATEEDSYCFMERQHSPTTPLDTVDSLDALSPSPFYRASPPKPPTALASPEQQKMAEPAAAAAPPKPPTPSRGALIPPCTTTNLAPLPMASAFAATASCPPGFIGFDVEDDPEQELDERRQVKSFECHLVDKLLDMSVSSLLSASSSRQLSGQLIGQHQQAKFGRVPIQNRLTA
ncbi:g3747 [Coccomyxa elongata]